MSSALPQTFSDPMTMQMHRFPVTLPFDRMVRGIGELQPDLLIGYPTMLHRLAFAASSGTLTISPHVVMCVSEPLLPETRSALTAAWNAPVLNFWATTEAMTIAVSCGSGPGMHLSDDLLIIEPVDAEGTARCPPGVRAAKVYVTNLSNCTPLPLIRYEITDEVTVLDHPCSCGSAYRLIDDVQGRLDDAFRYVSSAHVHPHVFRSRLGGMSGTSSSTRCGRRIPELDIDVHLGPPPRIWSRFGTALDSGSFPALAFVLPRIRITPVQHIERQRSGKLKRFIPQPTRVPSTALRDNAEETIMTTVRVFRSCVLVISVFTIILVSASAGGRPLARRA